MDDRDVRPVHRETGRPGERRGRGGGAPHVVDDPVRLRGVFVPRGGDDRHHARASDPRTASDHQGHLTCSEATSDDVEGRYLIERDPGSPPPLPLIPPSLPSPCGLGKRAERHNETLFGNAPYRTRRCRGRRARGSTKTPFKNPSLSPCLPVNHPRLPIDRSTSLRWRWSPRLRTAHAVTFTLARADGDLVSQRRSDSFAAHRWASSSMFVGLSARNV